MMERGGGMSQVIAIRRAAFVFLALGIALSAAGQVPLPQIPFSGTVAPFTTLSPPAPVAPPLVPSADPWSNPPGAFAIPGIRRYQRVDVDPGVLLRSVERLDGPFVLDLGRGLRWDLELERVSVRAPGYRVRLSTPQGLRDIAPGPELSFRGHIRGNPESRVRLSLAEGRITGFIDAGDGDKTFLEPLDQLQPGQAPGSHAVYKQSDLIMPAGAGCGWRPDGQLQPPGNTSAPGFRSPDPGAIPGAITVPGTPPTVPGLGKSSASQAAAAVEPCALVEIGVAAEYSMVKGYGSNAAVEKRINDIFNMVEGLYEDPRIDIHIKITELIIESGPNLTWGPMNINTYLGNITTWARSAQGFKNSYDVADLWYYDPLVATGTTGLANVGTVCNKTSGGHVIRDFTKTASFLMINQAHELGHNFGANHVNNPKAILNPMILGDNVSWDDTTIASILNHKHSRVCLSSCNQGPAADFLVKANSPCSDTRLFTDVSKGDPTSWLWNFGDGLTSKDRNPTHTYATEGVFTAQLTSTNAVGSNSISKGNIKVKPYAAPEATGARSCSPGALDLKATGAGILKWYDLAAGGNKVGEGTVFQTPALSASKTYFVETGDPDFPANKLGPAANTIGAGQFFTANSDRRMYFDVNRPAILKTAKVYASGAGPRTVEILDQGDVRVAARTVQVPDGESRVALNIELEPGHDYAIKYSGNPDSLKLFRNSVGAAFPYRSKDTLIVITHSDATPSDSTAPSGYYYFFYDWEVQERECGSVRVPVAAEISCVPIASVARAAGTLRQIGSGKYRFTGTATASQSVEFRVRALDGREARRTRSWIPPGGFALDLDLAGLPANLYLLEVRQGESRTLEKLIGF
ncbi:MAG: peptidase in kexin sedolisin [Fibrobacteres bacterium]|nr:peptidase in kexin sedolisin [Fibrobacterota bacterium]